MAEGGGQLSLSSFKEQFDGQLTCSVCLDQYTNPKTLPCHHSFCLHCIEQIPVVKIGNYCIACPTCRVDHQVPQEGVKNFPNAFHINSFLDLRKKLTSNQNAIPNQFTPTCPKHKNTLKAYCETCDQIICSYCASTNEHNKHTFHDISECYPKHHQQIQGNLDLVKHKLDDINTAMTHLDTREREVFEQGENIKEQINTHAQQLIDNIQQSRTHLTQQVDTIVQQKRQTLASQRQQVQNLHTQLKTCQAMIEHSLKKWNQQQILAQKIIMINEMKTATQHVDPAVFQPIEDANIQFNKNEKEMGSITSVGYGNIILKVPPCIVVDQPSTATLTLRSQNGSPFSLPPSLISSTLSSPGNKHFEKFPITQTQPGKYNITITPSTRNDQLILQVGGVDVPNSPFTLPVTVTHEMRGEPVNTITGLKNPASLAVFDNGDIVVAENGAHCITILNKRGKKTKRRIGGKGLFNNPRGVAVSTDGHILVTDDHRLQKLTTDGVCVKSVGSHESGSGQLEFNCPLGIAVHPTTAQIFVADCDNNRIQVFNNDFIFSQTISFSWIAWLLRSSTEFHGPWDIAVDHEGYLYIVDGDSPYIFKHTSSGKRIKSFGYTSDQEVITPYSVTVYDALVYVVCKSTSKDNIVVFDTDGKFQFRFGGDATVLDYPWDVSTDTIGNLYISDFDNNKIVVY